MRVSWTRLLVIYSTALNLSSLLLLLFICKERRAISESVVVRTKLGILCKNWWPVFIEFAMKLGGGLSLLPNLKSLCMNACVGAQSRLTLCDPMNCSLPGSSVHEFLQARIPEWVALPSSRGSSGPRDWNCISYVSFMTGGFFTTRAASWKAPNPSASPLYSLTGTFSCPSGCGIFLFCSAGTLRPQPWHITHTHTPSPQPHTHMHARMSTSGCRGEK